MSTSEGQHDDAPGQPLWLAAERYRVSQGLTKPDFVARMGIGRVTYDRLATQPKPPIARTVKKVADAVGLDYSEAMKLAGYVTAVLNATLPAIQGSFSASTNVQSAGDVDAVINLRPLREQAGASGRTLGDVLVEAGLATPEELKLTVDEVVEEIESDDLPDDLKQEFLDGYRQLREQVAEAARHRRGPD